MIWQTHTKIGRWISKNIKEEEEYYKIQGVSFVILVVPFLQGSMKLCTKI